jgi:molecular chaperone IbpA|tara:strand:+ start:1015 stop:1452 length:438 start_codon:yes stop_codon:yes gene_type:complete
MVNTAFTIDPSRINTYSIGFDRMFENLMDSHQHTIPNYPPCNIVKLSDDKYTIEIAVAGFSKEDIAVETKENILIIQSKDIGVNKTEVDTREYLHRGISARSFKKAFTLADDVVINGADMKDGLLFINLERIVPDEKKPRVIKIK